MPGTRTAPTVDGGNDFKVVTLKWIDYTSDKRSDAYIVDATLGTNAAIEAFAVAMQAVSNASLYDIRVGDVYSGAADGTSNALEEVWENVQDNLVLQAKQPFGGQSLRTYVPSPVESMFLEGTEDIDPANVPLGVVITTWKAMIAADYEVVGARFTHRRQINTQTPI